MVSGHGDLDGAAQGVLALDLGEVGGGVAVQGRHFPPGLGGGKGGQGDVADQETEGLVKGFDPFHLDALDERGLLRRTGGQQVRAPAQSAGEAGDGEGAFHRTGGAGEAEFAGDEAFGHFLRLQLLGGGQNAEGDGQVVERTLLPQVTRRQIDGRAGAGGAEAAVFQRGLDAVGGFLDGGIGQADEEPARFTDFPGIDFDLDQLGMDALEGRRSECC